MAASFIDRYRLGGVQDLPTAFSGLTSIRASFRGLDDSIRMQAEARTLWSGIMTRSVPPDVRRHMESDLVWFEATASRDQLLAATSDCVVAREQGLDPRPYRDGMTREFAILRQTPVLGDTASPVNQKLFLDQHARLAGLQGLQGGE